MTQAIDPLLARHGIEWIATDEEILGGSTNGKVGRDSRGYVRHPELLYRPWKVAESGHELAIVFRDHALSDQVGFHYQRSPGNGRRRLPGQAARDRRRLPPEPRDPRARSSSTARTAGNTSPTAASRSSGTSTRAPCATPASRPTTVGEFLRDHPPTDTLPRLFSGSWISHNFAIWIGHPEDNRAWDALHTPASSSSARPQSGPSTPRTCLERAWRELYIAEGSDWFWWYGDDHSSALDALFDHLFRKHLRNVYALLGAEPPGLLFAAISQSAQGRKALHDQSPNSFLRRHCRRPLVVLRVDQRGEIRLRERPGDDDARLARGRCTPSGSASASTPC